MAEHSPEPWKSGGDVGIYSITDSRDEIVADLDGISSPENVRRILACVNACAGIPTEKLETAAVVLAYQAE